MNIVSEVDALRIAKEFLRSAKFQPKNVTEIVIRLVSGELRELRVHEFREMLKSEGVNDEAELERHIKGTDLTEDHWDVRFYSSEGIRSASTMQPTIVIVSCESGKAAWQTGF